MKQLIAVIIGILVFNLIWPTQSTAQQIWIPWPTISPYYWIPPANYRTTPIVQWTPAHSRCITVRDTWIYRITPYGGTNYRTGWTNYRPRDTSWGYRQNRPRAKDLGIKGKHKYTHPNPRSLYRPR